MTASSDTVRTMPEAASGRSLFDLTQRRLVLAAGIANGVGGLVVLVFGLFAPGRPAPEDALRVGLLNLGTFVLFMVLAFPYGIWRGRRLARPLERWLAEERTATDEEQTLALRFNTRGTLISVRIWLAAVVAFTAVNATYSLELGLAALAIAGLGGATCCAVLYLLGERATRPIVARALAGRSPPRGHGPSVAARLTVAWVLVTGVPLLGIAGIAVADLAGLQIDTLTTIAMLILALAGLGVGLWATVTTASSVGEPVRQVQEAMSSVERGEFDARVPVDDGSEVGRLQAGFNRMATGLAERERVRDLFGRHVGEEVAEAALDGELRLGGEERDVAVLFIDVIGSTRLASQREPTEVVTLLNEFFRLVVETVERYGGWVNKFEGDAALCVFGAPTAREDAAGDALAAACELRERIVAGDGELDAGIGVSAGRAVAGNVGTEERFEYTVIGDPVNEAARLCELAKSRPERVLASATAIECAGPARRDAWRLGDEVELRGRAEATRLAAPVS